MRRKEEVFDKKEPWVRFAESLPPSQRYVSLHTLQLPIWVRGALRPRGEALLLLFKAGYRPVGDLLVHPLGRSLKEDQVTQEGFRFLRWLAR